VPTAQISWIVGIKHVGEPDSELAEDLADRAKRAGASDADLIAQVVAFALACHRANQALVAHFRLELSLTLLREAGLTPEMSVIDIGGGASRLVDALAESGRAHVSVLDLSAAALKTANSRLAGAARTQWIVSDVTAWAPDRQCDFWHDRAAFHFLTTVAVAGICSRVGNGSQRWRQSRDRHLCIGRASHMQRPARCPL